MYNQILKGDIQLEKVSERTTLRFIFGGDIYPARRPEQYAIQGRSSLVFGDTLKIFHDKDFSCINLECPLSINGKPIKKCGPNLRAHPATIDLLKAAKVDIAGLANNHIADFGNGPVVETLDLLKQNKIKSVGAGKEIQSASKPLVLKKNGVRLGILAFAENAFTFADRKRAGAWPLNPVANIAQIHAVKRNKNVDLVVVMVHGGNEYNPLPSPRMIELCRTFADAGANAVICHHPHVPQGIEIHRHVPILYSLGNLLFDEPETEEIYPFWARSFFVRMTFSGGKAARIELFPYRFKADSGTLSLMQDREKETFLQYLSDISRLIQDEKQIRRYWDAWCVRMGQDKLAALKECRYPWKDSDDQKKFLRILELFSLETHHELMTNLMTLIRFGEMDDAEKMIPNLEKLMNFSCG